MIANGVDDSTFETIKKRFKKKYAYKPQGYVTPEQISKDLIVQSFDPSFGTNAATFNSALVCAELAENNASWYWLDRKLAKDLLITNIPESIPNKIFLPKVGIIVTPSGLIPEDEINFIGYRIYKPGETPTVFAQNAKEKTQRELTIEFGNLPENALPVSWFAPVSNGIETLGGSIGLIPHKQEFEVLVTDIERITNNPEPSDKIITLLINCLVYCNPQNLDSSDKEKTKKGFGNKKSNIFYNPLWIGKGHTRNTIHKDSSGSHASPRTHWRRGHWRKSRIGKERANFRWNWIKPTLVNVGSNDHTTPT